VLATDQDCFLKLFEGSALRPAGVSLCGATAAHAVTHVPQDSLS